MWHESPISLIFLSLFFGNRQGEPPKKQGLFILSEPLKSLGKKGKTAEKSKEFLGKEKSKEFQESKERKIREFSVDSKLRAQLTKQPPQGSSKGEILCPKYGSEGFRVRLRRVSEYGSVACLVEIPTRETRTEPYSDTVLFKHRPNSVTQVRKLLVYKLRSQLFEELQSHSGLDLGVGVIRP